MKKEDKTKISPFFTGPHKIELKEWISCAPFEKLLGISIVWAQNGRACLTMPFVKNLAQGGGLLHGGAVVTLADTAVAMAVKSRVAPGSRFGTISLKSEFLHPVKSGTLTAKAKTEILPDRLVEGHAQVFDYHERMVMKFSAVFKLARDVTFNTPDTIEQSMSGKETGHAR